MPIYQFDSLTPHISPDAWIAPSTDIIGSVQIDAFASIWFNTVLRGDINHIHIGEKSNIQDGCVLHTDYDSPLIVDPFVSVGHQAMLHSCFIGEGSLIGMQAVLLNNCRIGRNSIVAAGALVPECKIFPDGVLLMGAPAKIVRELTEEEIQKVHHNTQHYVEKAQQFAAKLAKAEL